MEGASLPHFVFLPCRRTYSCSIRWLPLCHHRGVREGDAPAATADRRRKEEEEVATQMGVAVGASVGGGVRWMGDTLGPRQRLSLSHTHTAPPIAPPQQGKCVCVEPLECVKGRETASKRHFRSVPSKNKVLQLNGGVIEILFAECHSKSTGLYGRTRVAPFPPPPTDATHHASLFLLRLAHSTRSLGTVVSPSSSHQKLPQWPRRKGQNSKFADWAVL